MIISVRDLIAELSKVSNLDAPVTLVGGEDNGNCTIFDAPLTVQEGTDDQGLQFVEVCSLVDPNKED
jgi:hypothetical protein